MYDTDVAPGPLSVRAIVVGVFSGLCLFVLMGALIHYNYIVLADFLVPVAWALLTTLVLWPAKTYIVTHVLLPSISDHDLWLKFRRWITYSKNSIVFLLNAYGVRPKYKSIVEPLLIPHVAALRRKFPFAGEMVGALLGIDRKYFVPRYKQHRKGAFRVDNVVQQANLPSLLTRERNNTATSLDSFSSDVGANGFPSFVNEKDDKRGLMVSVETEDDDDDVVSRQTWSVSSSVHSSSNQNKSEQQLADDDGVSPPSFGMSKLDITERKQSFESAGFTDVDETEGSFRNDSELDEADLLPRVNSPLSVLSDYLNEGSDANSLAPIPPTPAILRSIPLLWNRMFGNLGQLPSSPVSTPMFDEGAHNPLASPGSDVTRNTYATVSTSTSGAPKSKRSRAASNPGVSELSESMSMIDGPKTAADALWTGLLLTFALRWIVNNWMFLLKVFIVLLCYYSLSRVIFVLRMHRGVRARVKNVKVFVSSTHLSLGSRYSFLSILSWLKSMAFSIIEGLHAVVRAYAHSLTAIFLILSLLTLVITFSALGVSLIISEWGDLISSVHNEIVNVIDHSPAVLETASTYLPREWVETAMEIVGVFRDSPSEVDDDFYSDHYIFALQSSWVDKTEWSDVLDSYTHFGSFYYPSISSYSSSQLSEEVDTALNCVAPSLSAVYYEAASFPSSIIPSALNSFAEPNIVAPIGGVSAVNRVHFNEKRKRKKRSDLAAEVFAFMETRWPNETAIARSLHGIYLELYEGNRLNLDGFSGMSSLKSQAGLLERRRRREEGLLFGPRAYFPLVEPYRLEEKKWDDLQTILGNSLPSQQLESFQRLLIRESNEVLKSNNSSRYEGPDSTVLNHLPNGMDTEADLRVELEVDKALSDIHFVCDLQRHVPRVLSYYHSSLLSSSPTPVPNSKEDTSASTIGFIMPLKSNEKTKNDLNDNSESASSIVDFYTTSSQLLLSAFWTNGLRMFYPRCIFRMANTLRNATSMVNALAPTLSTIPRSFLSESDYSTNPQDNSVVSGATGGSGIGGFSLLDVFNGKSMSEAIRSIFTLSNNNSTSSSKISGSSTVGNDVRLVQGGNSGSTPSVRPNELKGGTFLTSIFNLFSGITSNSTASSLRFLPFAIPSSHASSRDGKESQNHKSHSPVIGELLESKEFQDTIVNVSSVGTALSRILLDFAPRALQSSASITTRFLTVFARLVEPLLRYVLETGGYFFSLFMSFLLFLSLLYYLLSSERDWLSSFLDFLPKETSSAIQTTLSVTVQNALIVHVKTALFHFLFTYLIASVMHGRLPCTCAILSALSSLLPFLPSSLSAVIVPLEILISGKPFLSLLLFTFHSVFLSYADWYMLEDSKTVHPSVLGLAIIGGTMAFGVQGVIVGPLLVSLLLASFLLVEPFLRSVLEQPDRQVDISHLSGKLRYENMLHPNDDPDIISQAELEELYPYEQQDSVGPVLEASGGIGGIRNTTFESLQSESGSRGNVGNQADESGENDVALQGIRNSKRYNTPFTSNIHESPITSAVTRNIDPTNSSRSGSFLYGNRSIIGNYVTPRQMFRTPFRNRQYFGESFRSFPPSRAQINRSESFFETGRSHGSANSTRTSLRSPDPSAPIFGISSNSTPFQSPDLGPGHIRNIPLHSKNRTSSKMTPASYGDFEGDHSDNDYLRSHPRRPNNLKSEAEEGSFTPSDSGAPEFHPNQLRSVLKRANHVTRRTQLSEVNEVSFSPTVLAGRKF